MFMGRRGFKNRFLLFVIYLLFAIYFVNVQFLFLTVPEFILKFNSLISFLGGLLLFFAAFKQLMKSRKKESLL